VSLVLPILPLTLERRLEKRISAPRRNTQEVEEENNPNGNKNDDRNRPPKQTHRNRRLPTQRINLSAALRRTERTGIIIGIGIGIIGIGIGIGARTMENRIVPSNRNRKPATKTVERDVKDKNEHPHRTVQKRGIVRVRSEPEPKKKKKNHRETTIPATIPHRRRSRHW